MSSVRPERVAVSWFLVACVAGVGCGGARPEPASPAGQHLERIGNAYLRATIGFNHPPANEKELLPFLREQGKPEELLRSPADGEPFVLVWGVELRRLTATGNDVPVVAYEKTGKDGKRHVLRGRADVSLLTDRELKNATFPKGYLFPF
jgi:hypothetical protein